MPLCLGHLTMGNKRNNLGLCAANFLGRGQDWPSVVIIGFLIRITKFSWFCRDGLGPVLNPGELRPDTRKSFLSSAFPKRSDKIAACSQPLAKLHVYCESSNYTRKLIHSMCNSIIVHCIQQFEHDQRSYSRDIVGYVTGM